MRFSEIISENKKGCPCCGCASKTKCTCPPDCPDCDCHNNIKEAKATSQRLDPKCWKGYKKQGTKVKGGVRVNNCVPVSEDTQTFDHVSNKRLRRILVLGPKDPAEVEWAMDFTYDALMTDYDDEMIPSSVYDARNKAYDSAEASFDEGQGDLDATLAHLKQFWRV
jgi:hypothetical protein